MKIYIAAAYARQDRALGISADLRGLGFDVVSTWHDSPEADDAAVLDRDKATIVERALLEISRCDLLVALTEGERSPYGRGGRHAELGAALVMGKQVIAVGRRENLFYHHHNVVHVNEETALRRILAFIAARDRQRAHGAA
jgi:nucleoside 2-deoxyribosyltransferase